MAWFEKKTKIIPRIPGGFPNYDRIPTAVRATARYLPLGNLKL